MGALRKLPTGPRGGPISGRPRAAEWAEKSATRRGFRQAAQIGEQLQSCGEFQEPPVGLLRQSRREEALDLPGVADDGEAAPAGPGQQARPVHHPLQDGVQVQVFGDAQAGLAQPGQPVSEVPVLQVPGVVPVHLFTSRTGCGRP